jgi:transposase-like protein
VVLNIEQDATKIDAILQKVLGDNEDARQDAWLAILAEGASCDNDIYRLAKRTKRRYVSKVIEQRKEISLDEPIGKHRDDGTFTFRNILKAPEAKGTTEYAIKGFQNGHYGNPHILGEIVGKDYKPICKFCESSNVVRNGKRGKLDVQYWLCRTCGRGFTANGALPYWRFPKYIIQEALRMYLAGYSYDKIRHTLYSTYKVEVKSDNTLRQWFKRLGKLNRKPNVHTRRDYGELVKMITREFCRGVIYSARDVLVTCGYSPSTKLQATQLLKGHIVSHQDGGIIVNESLYANI